MEWRLLTCWLVPLFVCGLVGVLRQDWGYALVLLSLLVPALVPRLVPRKTPKPGALYAWVGEDAEGHGLARLKTAYLPLGTINLAAFDKGVMTAAPLVAALQEQADEDGQVVRLLRFAPEAEMMAVRPRHPLANGQVAGR
jgi:hypothetical protein